MIKKFIDYFKKTKTEEPKKEILKKEFNIEDFNNWFKTEFDGYDGRKGAAGIFLRTNKLSPYWVETYLEYIGQDTSYENIQKHYELVRKDWINKLHND
jgi:hypothetical protein